MNWGKKLLIIHAVFCIVLLSFMHTLTKEVKVSLVNKDYRLEDKNYQQLIESKQRAKLISDFRIVKTGPFILLELPKEQLADNIRGEVFFYCVYDEQFDKTIQLVFNDQRQQMIPQSWIIGKRYKVKLNWHDGKHTYYTEHDLNMNN